MLVTKTVKQVFSFIAMFLVITTVLVTGADESDESEDDVKIAAVDVYDFTMSLRIPRIYNNERSLGSRKYQRQRIVGEMRICYDATGSLVKVLFANMVNKTHRLSSGALLTYPNTRLDTLIYPRFNAIGSNKTGKFDVASVCFYLAAEPSYNVGEFSEDNALYVMLSGRGKFHPNKKYLKSVSGKAAGILGCGCMAYGHVSPTRKIGYWGATDVVDDVAAVDGTWSIKFNSEKSSKR